MSIIYDALQKTQRNREYLRLQNSLTQSKPHRRNIKPMVLGSLLLTLSAGGIAIYSFYGRPMSGNELRPAVTQTHPRQQDVTPPSAHFWVTDGKRVTAPPQRALVQQSLPVPASPVVAEVQAAQVPVTSSPVFPEVQSARVSAQANPVFMKAQPSPVPVQANPVFVEAQPSPVPVQANPVFVEAQPSSVPVQASPVFVQVQPSQAPQVVAQPAPLPVNMALSSSKLTLNGVLISGSEKIALINNQTFRLGDLVDGMKVVSIDSTSVKLQSGGELLELRVPV